MRSTANFIRPLGAIAKVQPGYPSRASIRSDPTGTHLLLQGKDVSGDAGVSFDQLVRFHPERKPELYQLTRGDILVVARGQDHRVHYIERELTNTLAAATFYIVRPDGRRVCGGYLAWWLNLPRVQAELDARSRGTNIAYVSRKAIEALQVPVAPLSVQERIERAFYLWRMRKSLQSRIDVKREQCIQAVCRQAVRRSKER